MKKSDRNEINTSLRDDWRSLPDLFHQLSEVQQECYLDAQGYHCFRDLVAHIIAWWERGMELIERYRADASFTAPPVDVDEFNAQVVANVQDRSEKEVLAAFEKTRRRWLTLIRDLTDHEWRDERITHQLMMEIIGHFNEHRIQKPADG